MSTATPKPRTDLDTETLDVLAEYPFVRIKASAVKEGMVLVDPVLGTPEAFVSTATTTREGRQYVRRFVLQDLNTGRFEHYTASTYSLLPVLAS
jgi:hypothetical protein